MHLAAQNIDVKMVTLLLGKGALITSENELKMTALHVAAWHGHKEVAELLIANEADRLMVAVGGMTALHFAARNGHVIVLALLMRNGANIEAETYESQTFDLAGWAFGRYAQIDGGSFETIYQEASGSILSRKAYHKMTPLHFAAINVYKEAVALLLDNQANINAVAEYDLTPLHLATLHGGHEVIELLLQRKANVNALCYQTFTVPHLAALKGNFELINFFLSKGCSIKGSLHAAVLAGCEIPIAPLLQLGEDIDSLSSEKFTPLHVAAINGHTKCLQFLLTKGANINMTDGYGRTPLH